MKKELLILIIMLISLYSIDAALPSVSLKASAYGNDVTLTWSYREEALLCTNQCRDDSERQCSSYGYQLCGDFNNDGCLEWGNAVSCNSNEICSNGECVIATGGGGGSYGVSEEATSYGTESDSSIIEEVPESSAYGSYGAYGTGQTIRLFTGNTILDNIKNIFVNIIETLKRLFGFGSVGSILNYEFEIYRNNELIASGKNADFNCQRNTCSYVDGDLPDGDYNYNIKIKDLDGTESKDSNQIKAIINIELPTSYGAGGEAAAYGTSQEIEETAISGYGANLTNMTDNDINITGSINQTVISGYGANLTNETVQIPSSETPGAGGGGGSGSG